MGLADSHDTAARKEPRPNHQLGPGLFRFAAAQTHWRKLQRPRTHLSHLLQLRYLAPQPPAMRTCRTLHAQWAARVAVGGQRLLCRFFFGAIGHSAFHTRGRSCCARRAMESIAMGKTMF